MTMNPRFRTMLLAEREALAQRIRALTGGLHIEQVADSLDATSNQQARDSVAGDLLRLRQQAADVECAIARWNLGVYGECLSCDKPIKESRLEAIAWAALCVKCQEAQDSKGEAL